MNGWRDSEAPMGAGKGKVHKEEKKKKDSPILNVQLRVFMTCF